MIGSGPLTRHVEQIAGFAERSGNRIFGNSITIFGTEDSGDCAGFELSKTGKRHLSFQSCMNAFECHTDFDSGYGVFFLTVSQSISKSFLSML